jgi:hypothetical protein
MLRHDFVSICGIGLGTSIGILGGCTPIELPPPQVAAVTFEVDPSMTSPDGEDTVMSEGEERPVGMLLGPDGVTERFVEDEVVVRAETQEELDAFLAKYGGVVLRDGTVPSLPDDMIEVEIERASWYLVRVDLSMSSLDDMPANFEEAGIEGKLVFSSEDAARLSSIVAREAPNGAAPNLVLDLTSSLEHPDYSQGHLDAEDWKWMVEDDNPFREGDQGLSVGVIHAWDYLTYRKVPPLVPPTDSSFYTPVRVAVIDRGFALSTSTGRPLNDNVDFFNTTNAPIQWDEADDDSRAGGSGESSKPWHGQEAFGVCCAAERNQFGGAGTGGPVAQPMLIKTGATIYSAADAIYTAGNMGAHVINLSFGGFCGITCRTADIFWDNQINDAVTATTRVGAIVVAGAGNEGQSLDSGASFIPCEVLGVLCVGSVLLDNANGDRVKTRHNFGMNVAISAPEGVTSPGIFSTLTPAAVDFDTDDFATSSPSEASEDELGVFTGTSCATAFTSGIVALMKAADPDLNWEQVREILQATANRPQSVDDRVPNGYVDAYRAVVESMSPNQPPTISMTQPVNGQIIGWNTRPFFKTLYDDPEVDPTDLTALERFHGEVVITSSIDGELCRDKSLPYDCMSTLPQLTIGEHTITATATDAFGESAIDEITVQVVNRAPEPTILFPSAGKLYYSHIPILFSAFIADPDETILGDNVTWSSDIEGVMSNGFEFSQVLTTGTHTITLEAVDGLGLSATDEVTIEVLTGVGAPTPVITSPVYGTLVAPGQMITITGEATDPEDGVLPPGSLEWSSSIDGMLGTGNSIQVILSSPPGPICETGAAHDITLKATDSDGKEVTVTILIRVGIVC